MTASLSKKGQIDLPASVRRELRLSVGDAFEIMIEDGETIVLRRISRPANRGLVDLLLSRPTPFEVPPREHSTA